MGSSIEQYRRMLVVNFGELAKPAASPTPEMAKPTTASPKEIARNFVESQRPSTLVGYATATPLATGFLETALAKEASKNGISR